MQNLITIENTNAVVELSTIIKFSKLGDEAVKKIVKRKINMLIKNGLSYPYDLSEDLNYSEMKFDEKSCTLLLTLLPNNEITEKFKEELVNQFFTMRDEIQKIREDALRIEFSKEKAKAIRDAKKPKVYDNGFMSLKGCLVELKEQGIEVVKEHEAWDMLVHYGYVKTMPKITISRDIDTDNEIAKYVMASRTSYGLPTFDLKFINDLVYKYIQDGKPTSEEADELRERFSNAAIKYVDENLLA